MYKTRLASNEIFSPSNNIYWGVGRAKDLSAPLYTDVSNNPAASSSGYTNVAVYVTKQYTAFTLHTVKSYGFSNYSYNA
jgi:hypothetical protein